MRSLRSLNRWPIILGLIGVLIVVASVWYTNRLANQLAAIELNYVTVYELAQQSILRDDLDGQGDFSVESYILENNTTIPAIWVNEQMELVDAMNFDRWDEEVKDTAYIMEELSYIIEHSDKPPIQLPIGGTMYFGSSRLIGQLRLFPILQLSLIGIFVITGLVGILAARRSEQNRVWVGMAKETAHQLGTPISGIMGWVDHIQMMYPEDADLMEINEEMRKDVQRLDMVATRFSKIGAEPELDPVNAYVELEKCRAYMEKRASRKVEFDFPNATDGNVPIAINPLLFDWVLENLVRNALDALDGKGRISGRIREREGRVMIDISDTGKGIAPQHIRKVFSPGFTTKKRGWGLGLSLVKRIVEEYHRGKIAVTASEPGKGTTFTITLPKAG